MSGKEKIEAILLELGVRAPTFANSIGLIYQRILDIQNGKTKKITAEVANAIVERYPQFSYQWMLKGEGEMLESVREDVGGAVVQNALNLIPLLPIAAQGGSLNDFVESVEISKCEKMLCPVDGVDFAMAIKGDSMNPEYPNGSIIFIKRINERAFIEWGKVYVLDTCNGTVVKEIHKGDVDSGVVCYSTNPDPKYQPFEVNFGDLYGMYRVVMCMSMK